MPPWLLLAGFRTDSPLQQLLRALRHSGRLTRKEHLISLLPARLSNRYGHLFELLALPNRRSHPWLECRHQYGQARSQSLLDRHSVRHRCVYSGHDVARLASV